MIDAAIERLREALDAHNAEIFGWRQPGFEPADTMLRTSPRVLATHNPLSAVAEPDARFVVLDSRGLKHYTRDGGFQLDGGNIVTGRGDLLLGYLPGGAVLQPLRVPQNDMRFGRVNALHLEADGALVYERSLIDPHTSATRHERVLIGNVALARFPAGSLPVSNGITVNAPVGIEPHLGIPGDGSFAALRVGMRDEGSLDINRALAQLHDMYQQLDAMTAARNASFATEKTVLDVVK